MSDTPSRLTAEVEDRPTVTLYYGDETWHDGSGWYYIDDEYPEDGSCGAFTFRQDAEAHARECGYEITSRTPREEVGR